MSITPGSQGLEVQIGASGHRKLRAAQQGLYYWDKECQQVILSYLEEFLPRVSEYSNGPDSRGVFQKVVEGREVCANSKALAQNRLPRPLLESLGAAVARMRQSKDTPGISPEAKLL